jgi:hypothetical protein
VALADAVRVGPSAQAGLVAISLAAGACAYWPARPKPASAEEALLTRRVEGLRRLLAAGRTESLLDFKQILVVVPEDIVRDLLRATMPFEKTIADRYRIEVASATTEFSDGFALVRLAGRAEMIGRPVSAEVDILGGLEVLGLESSGVLRCHVRVFAVEAKEANVAGLDEPVRSLVEDVGRDGLNSLLSEFDVPVRVENRLVLPAVKTRRLKLAAAEVPVTARVVEVRVFAHRLWVGVSASVGETASATATASVAATDGAATETVAATEAAQ